MIRPASLLLLALFILPVAADPAPDDSPLVPAAPLPAEEWYRVNASARGLAGRYAPHESNPVNWENTDAWKDYKSWIDGRWTYIDRVRLNAMRTWAVGALGDLRGKSTVFYPFSGPDVLYVDTLFPNSKYLLMAGLEPVGSMPDFADLQDEGKLPAYLSQVKTSLYTILAASFFKTKDMKTDFSGLVEGILPAMVVFLSHEGDTIDSIHYVSVASDGTLHEHGATGATGVQITFFHEDRDNMRVLLYFQTDLGNDGIKEHPGFARLMDRLSPGVTYLKAASYLLHDDYFSDIRDAILKDSVGVVEDDSGIPFRAFKPDLWNVTAYGNYTGPIKLFDKYNQPDLTAFYAKSAPSALTFGSGYKFVAEESSLLVARRK